MSEKRYWHCYGAVAALRRSQLREIHPVNENSGAADDGPAATTP